jgi:phthalate 4,5-dioxygenase oxygenase subunit
VLSAADNELLTRTGPGTAMGELFRRFWVPLLLARELPEPDCPPVRVKILGEDLVAFRDSEGEVGLVEPRCAHRGADLFFGRNEECGLRCVYHGWKFDVHGACVEAPTVPAADVNDRFLQKAAIKAYPVREWGDLLWAYFGPAEHVGEGPGQGVEPPMLEFAMLAPEHRYVDKKLQESNWAQLVEGGLDTAHFSFLHMPVDVDRTTDASGPGGVGLQQVRWMKDDPQPTFDVKDHAAGIVIGGARKADRDDRYWRITQYLLPNHSLAPGTLPGKTYNGQTWVPIDDVTTWVFCYSWNPDRPLRDVERGYVEGVPSIYSEVDEHFFPVRNRANDYGIDRDEQKHRTYTGIKGLSEQDAAIQESQGLIADRTRELLGPTDLGVVRFRRLMLRAAKDLEEGIEPAAASKPEAYLVRSGGIVVDGSCTFDDVLEARFGSDTGFVGQLEP